MAIIVGGYRVIKKYRAPYYEHILVAQKALGKKLPYGAVVHHVNENKLDNHTPFNLIICPSQSYHKLLHKLMKAYVKEHGAW